MRKGSGREDVLSKAKNKRLNSIQEAYIEYQRRESAVSQAQMEQIKAEKNAINICLREYGNVDKQRDFLAKLKETYYSEKMIQTFESKFSNWNQDYIDINTVKDIADALQHISQTIEDEGFIQKAGRFVNSIMDQGKG